ncbi:MAG: hypothetical protein GX185_08700 [Tissierellia bacterium]|nr:hypothetical protein [Tissierellia bacterium]
MADFKTDGDMKGLAEVLDTVSEKVPKLIKEIIGTLYSPEAGKNMGKAVGSLYKELLDSGIPEDVALDMAKSYMISMKDFSNIMK